jgi:hypothetical protein
MLVQISIATAQNISNRTPFVSLYLYANSLYCDATTLRTAHLVAFHSAPHLDFHPSPNPNPRF